MIQRVDMLYLFETLFLHNLRHSKTVKVLKLLQVDIMQVIRPCRNI